MTLFKRAFAGLAMAAALVVAPVQANVLTVGGGWTVLAEDMVAPAFFLGADGSGLFTFDCRADHCKFLITDLFVVSDQYEVYDFGVLIATTPAMPDWDALGEPDPFDSPPFTSDPDVAFASGDFSALVIFLATGVHDISIRDIHIPPLTAGGDPFPDGTVAFRVTVPEPASLALLGIALVGLGFARRKS